MFVEKYYEFTIFTIYFRHPLWIRKSTLVGRESTCQYGTQQVKNDFMLWAQYITGCLMGQFWFMTLQMKTHFRRCVVIKIWRGSVGRDGYSTSTVNSQIIHWPIHQSRSSHLFIHIRLHSINPNKVKEPFFYTFCQSVYLDVESVNNIIYMCLFMKSMCQVHSKQKLPVKIKRNITN